MIFFAPPGVGVNEKNQSLIFRIPGAHIKFKLKMFDKIIKNINNRTLFSVGINYIRINFWHKIVKPKTLVAAPIIFLSRVTNSPDEAIEFLIKRVEELTNPDQYALFISSDDKRSGTLKNQLTQKKIKIVQINIEEIAKFAFIGGPVPSCLFTSFLNAGIIHQIGELLLRNQFLINVPFEYVCIPKAEYSALEKYDDFNLFSFVSPLLISEINFNELYEQSLDHFDLRTPYFRYTAKCDIRDFMDLLQVITNVVKNEIEGEIAEFGSYKGHSGYLISEVLKKSGSDKILYMFDTFEKFPGEELGIDSFWSDTHKVNFDEVKRKLADQTNIILVKGDFTETLPMQGIKKLSLIYVDCDSFRATKFLVEFLYNTILSKGGFMVFEDYGHQALLGNRLAIHQFFDNKKGCIKFFSQFSAFYIVVKL